MRMRPHVPAALMGVCEEGPRNGIPKIQIDPAARVEAVKLAVYWWKDRNGEAQDVVAFANALIACIEGRD